jgi:hypothetical protein
MAVQVARVHLLAGYDVVMPQFLGRVEFTPDDTPRRRASS